MQFQKDLQELCSQRTQITKNLLELQTLIMEHQVLIEQQTLKIKLDCINTINTASQDDAKTKYSNEAKRKLFIEDSISSNQELASLVKNEHNVKKALIEAETTNQISKIHERYLFKEIDLYICEKQKDNL